MSMRTLCRSAIPILVVLISGSPIPGSAKAIPMRMPDLLKRADVIVTGTITNLHDHTFEITVGQTLRSDQDTTQVLTVHKFRDWACHQRSPAYAVGQQRVFFLSRKLTGMQYGTAETSGILSILGPHDEGEMMPEKLPPGVF